MLTEAEGTSQKAALKQSLTDTTAANDDALTIIELRIQELETELDSATAAKVVGLFRHLVEEEGLTILMTTHDMSLLGAGDRTFTLESGRLEDTV